MTAEKTSEAPAVDAADAPATKPAPLFGEGVTFGAAPGGIAFGAASEDLDAMCVWDGDAVVCTPQKNDKG